jgi:NodT family efflux transporter outer membrane factor (OMF) lipoprotein
METPPVPDAARPKRLFLPLPLALGLSLLAGCSLVPQYQTPAVPAAASWDSVSAQQGSAAAGGAWWREFSDSELDALIQRGLQSNNNLAAAMARIDQARGNAEVAASGLFPQLSLDGTYQRQDNYSTTAKRSVALGASYEIDFWGAHRAAADSADQLTQASLLDAQTVRMTLTASIADSYFQVLSLQDRIRLAQTIADDARQVLQLVQVQASLGSASDLEVAQQRNALRTFEAAVPTLRQQRDQALYQLAVLVGAAPQGFSLQRQQLGEMAVPFPSVGVPLDLLAQRPDIQAAEARLKSANFDVGVARAAFLPNVSINLLGGVDTLGSGAIWSVLGSIAQPLFTGGQLEGQLDTSKARSRELLADYREQWIEALQDVQTQISARQQLQQSYGLNQAAVQAAREASHLAQVRYRLGSIDFQTLLIAERTQYQAEDALLQVQLQHLQSSVGLFRALGGDFRQASAAIAQASSVATSTPSDSARQEPRP